MNAPRTTVLALEIVVVGAYVLYCYSVYRISKAGSNDSELGTIYMRFSQLCFYAAEKFGRWGIRYEMKAIDEFEQNRMI